MKCQDLEQLIFTYLDGCLDSQIESEFVSHLSQCKACQQEVESAQKLNKLLEDSCTLVQPPADFVSGVMSRIDQYEKSKANPSKLVSFQKTVEKKSLLERIFQSGVKFSKVASYVALVAAIGAFMAFAKIPEITKMADLGYKFGQTPVTDEKDLPITSDPALIPGQSDQKGNIKANETPVEEELDEKEPESAVESEKPAENGEELPASNPGSEKPASGEKTSSSPSAPKDIEEPESPASSEEEEPDLPRLDGPFRQVTGITSVVAKSVSLTPVSQDDNYVSCKPAWDERGKKVYYFSNKEATAGKYTLWAKGINDSSAEIVARNVTKTLNIDQPQSKSPDGQYKLYQEEGQLFVAKIDGSDPRPLTPKLEGAHFNYAWRPDSKRVAVSVKGSPSQGLWLADANGGEWSLITTNGGGASLSWSPDGKKIAFTDTNHMIYVGILVAENKTNLLMVVPEGDRQGNVSLAWSPDSRSLLFDWARGDSPRGVYLATIPD